MVTDGWSPSTPQDLVGLTFIGSTAEISVVGALDAGSAPAFDALVDAALEVGDQIVISFAAVEVFTAAAVRSLVRALERAAETGVQMHIPGLPPHVSEVLRVTGIEDERLTSIDPASARHLPGRYFDAVVMRGVLNGREGVTITTDDIDDPKIVFVNQALCAITGYRADDLLGVNPKIFQGPLTERSVIDRLKNDLVTRQDFDGETINYRSDGSPFYMNWRIVETIVGGSRYWMALQRDTTQLRALTIFQASLTLFDGWLAGDEERSTRIEVDAAAAAAAELFVGGGVASLETETRSSDSNGVRVSSSETSLEARVSIPRNREAVLRVDGLHPDRIRLTDADLFGTLLDQIAPHL